MNAARPCPRCGSSPMYCVVFYPTSNEPDYVVRCRGCALRAPGTYATWEDAVVAWNEEVERGGTEHREPAR